MTKTSIFWWGKRGPKPRWLKSSPMFEFPEMRRKRKETLDKEEKSQVYDFFPVGDSRLYWYTKPCFTGKNSMKLESLTEA